VNTGIAFPAQVRSLAGGSAVFHRHPPGKPQEPPGFPQNLSHSTIITVVTLSCLFKTKRGE